LHHLDVPQLRRRLTIKRNSVKETYMKKITIRREEHHHEQDY